MPLAGLGRVSDAPGAFAIRPADGRTARVIGLAGGEDAVLWVGAAGRSLREELAKHLAPSHVGDSDLRADLAVSRLGNDPADPFGENAGGPGRRGGPDEAEGAILEALGHAFPFG